MRHLACKRLLCHVLCVCITNLTFLFLYVAAIGKQLASKHKYELDSSLELIGLGMANFCGAIFNSYPVTGSFSRSAVNNESGAQSGISGFVTATIVGLVLLFMTTVFEKMVSDSCAFGIACFAIVALSFAHARLFLYVTASSNFGVDCDFRGAWPLGL